MEQRVDELLLAGHLQCGASRWVGRRGGRGTAAIGGALVVDEEHAEGDETGDDVCCVWVNQMRMGTWAGGWL